MMPGLVEKTGLSGTYDLHLEWTDVPLNDIPNSDVSARPSIFTALQEQLGLRLEAQKGPVDTIVIDRAQKANEN